MDIAIIGDGQVGRALARALRRAGHAVRHAVRDPAADSADQGPIASTVAAAEIAVLAVPFAAAPAALGSAGDLSGKVVIDLTNPLAMSDGRLGLSVGTTASGAEQLQAAFPSARIVKTFNQTGLENLGDASGYQLRPMMFFAGNDAAARALAAGLVTDAGFEAIDVGDLRAARLLEPLAMLWIELGRVRGMGPNFTFALQRKD